MICIKNIKHKLIFIIIDRNKINRCSEDLVVQIGEDFEGVYINVNIYVI